ncbi:MAG: hypothetical protein KatS3mg011_1049 [Acidimicrobiia bacterium]|nr:MAG: hypothetical protein KatS3mg011_1049 [Acidimicrobiia bacterium]
MTSRRAVGYRVTNRNPSAMSRSGALRSNRLLALRSALTSVRGMGMVNTTAPDTRKVTASNAKAAATAGLANTPANTSRPIRASTAYRADPTGAVP